MLREAPLVMLDEPANGMDPDARAMLAEVLREVAAGGATVLVSSHVLTELDAFCDAFVVLARGRMVGHGTAQELHGAEAGTLTVAVTLLGDAAAQRRVIEASVTRVDGARLSRVDGNGLWVQVSDDPVAQAALLRALVDAGLLVVSFTPERPQIASLYGQLARRT
jgi:ABC-2 type transport system ATP-binding protein